MSVKLYVMTAKTKNTIAYITTGISVITVCFLLLTKLTGSVKADTRFRDATIAADSLQWLAIRDIKEANGNTNLRVDDVVDEQATVNAAILKTMNRIEQKQDNQDKVLRIIMKQTKGLENMQILLETSDNQNTQ